MSNQVKRRAMASLIEVLIKPMNVISDSTRRKLSWRQGQLLSGSYVPTYTYKLVRESDLPSFPHLFISFVIFHASEFSSCFIHSPHVIYEAPYE